MGIINFRGKRDKTIFKPAEQILVSDYMTKKLITFKPSDSLGHVINLLIKNKILAPKLYNQNYKNNYIEIQDLGKKTLFDILKRKKTNKLKYLYRFKHKLKY